MYIVLIALLFSIFVISLLAFNRELLAPAVVTILMFLFTALIGILRWSDWEISSYSGDAAVLLIIGLVSFFVGSIIPRARYNVDFLKAACKPIRRDRIEISSFIIFIFIVIGIFANIPYFLIMRRIVEELGFSLTSVAVIINHFRNITTNAYFEDMYAVPSYARIFYWTLTSIGIFTLFVFLHNLTFRCYKRKDLFLLTVTFLWIFLMLLNSHRSYILTAFAIGIYSVYFFMNMYYGWNYKVNRKIFKIGVRLFVFVIAGFIVLAVALGRYESIKSMNLIDYTTVYTSSGIRNFDLFLKEPHKQPGFGLETFTSLFRTLNNRLNLGYDVARPELEFRYINGLKISNVYTAFRRYYSDFSTMGIIVISLMLGYFFSALYEKIKIKSKAGIIDFRLILFLYFCKSLFQMCIEETFLLTEISLNGLYKIIVLYFLYFFLIKKKIRVVIHH